MRTWLSITLLTLSVATYIPSAIASTSYDFSAELDSTSYVPSRERQNALSVELGGRAGYYSVNYDRIFDDHFSLGAGISTFSLSEENGGSSHSQIAVPLYVNFYNGWGRHRGYLTAGTDLSTTSRRPEGFGFRSNAENGAYGILGVGYEYRGRKALLFRLAAYTLTSRLSVWLGASLGYAF